MEFVEVMKKYKTLCQSQNGCNQCILRLLDPDGTCDNLMMEQPHLFEDYVISETEGKCDKFHNEFGRSVCYGTKNKEQCTCNGYKKSCDFY